MRRHSTAFNRAVEKKLAVKTSSKTLKWLSATISPSRWNNYSASLSLLAYVAFNILVAHARLLFSCSCLCFLISSSFPSLPGRICSTLFPSWHSTTRSFRMTGLQLIASSSRRSVGRSEPKKELRLPVYRRAGRKDKTRRIIAADRSRQV